IEIGRHLVPVVDEVLFVHERRDKGTGEMYAPAAEGAAHGAAHGAAPWAAPVAAIAVSAECQIALHEVGRPPALANGPNRWPFAGALRFARLPIIWRACRCPAPRCTTSGIAS